MVTRIFDIPKRSLKLYPHNDFAFSFRENNQWKHITFSRLNSDINAIASGMLAIGLKKGDRIAIIAPSRPEYNIIDYAAMTIGCISVPIYPTISQEDYQFIFTQAQIKAAFIEGKELQSRLQPIFHKLTHLKFIYTILPHEDSPYPTYQNLLELGKENLNTYLPVIEQISRQIQPDDLATIIYTSGTTGTPKGVMLSHNNIVMQVLGVRGIYKGPRCRTLSFLPLCHAYERMMVYYYQYEGWHTYYCRNVGTIATDLKDADPSVMTCVPRVLEKFYDRIVKSGKQLPTPQRNIFNWALKLALQYQFDDRTTLYNIQHYIADKLVYSSIRQTIGGHFQVVVNGGAALAPRLASFFTAIGMPIIEGYGLSETSPVITVSRKGYHQRRPGFVGVALPGVKIQIDNNGEILTKGHNVMLGYYKNPKLTAQVIDHNGWLHTGDTGELTPEGLLKITGRVKALFKTSLGKYINPELIETACTQSALIENIVVAGENQRYPVAIIQPNQTALEQLAQTLNISYNSFTELCNNKDIIKAIRQEIEQLTSSFADYEKIQKFTLTPDTWDFSNYISPTLKVKRQKVIKHYQDAILGMY